MFGKHSEDPSGWLLALYCLHWILDSVLGSLGKKQTGGNFSSAAANVAANTPACFSKYLFWVGTDRCCKMCRCFFFSFFLYVHFAACRKIPSEFTLTENSSCDVFRSAVRTFILCVFHLAGCVIGNNGSEVKESQEMCSERSSSSERSGDLSR